VTPLLSRIERELAGCTNPLQEAELLAERACYFARTGNFAGANAIVASLRQVYGDGRNVRISVWIMLIEGLILYFDQTDPAAQDRLMRAHLISDAADLQDLRQLTAAWLAHIEFNRSEFDSMLKLLRRVVDSRRFLIDGAGIRFKLLVADSYMYCGHTHSAVEWYQRARQSAVSCGDQASIASLIYNKSALALSQLRIASALESADLSTLRFIALEIESAYSFHVGTAHASLVQLIESCRARALLMEGRFSEAKVLFESLLARPRLPLGLKSDRLIIELEYTQCIQNLGLAFDAHEQFLKIDAEHFEQLAIDDQLVFLLSYVSLGKVLNLHDRVVVYAEKVNDVRDRYLANIQYLKTGLDELCANLSEFSL